MVINLYKVISTTVYYQMLLYNVSKLHNPITFSEPITLYISSNTSDWPQQRNFSINEKVCVMHCKYTGIITINCIYKKANCMCNIFHV